MGDRVAAELVERVRDPDQLGELGAMMRVFMERGLGDPGLADRLGDAVLDLAADDLARWLAAQGE